MNNDAHVFQVLYKSQYTVTRSTVENIIKELNNEIRYQATVALPNVHTSVRKQNVLANIDRLRKQRDSLMLKYQSQGTKKPEESENFDIEATDEHYEKHIEKSVSKKDILKALYCRLWGGMTGLDANKLEKMNDSELDREINAMSKIFD